MPEMLLKSSMERGYSQVATESMLSKHIKIAVGTDVNVVPIDLEMIAAEEKEAEDHHPTMSASYAEKQVIGKQKISFDGGKMYIWKNEKMRGNLVLGSVTIMSSEME